MSDMKSKIPDFKELASMTGKLFNDIKVSVTQIIQDYKDVRAETSTEEKSPEEAKSTAPKAKKTKDTDPS